jgi:Glycosyl hydrolases family 38 C-terminal domain/Glycosyl hydrolases family 38 C-terminal beta sandwich domain
VEFEQPWIKQTMRLYESKNYVEVEYTVGPIPVEDGIGKEVVTKYASGIKSGGVFFTDSNGREFQKRVRSFRPTWNLEEFEPVAGNYYPVNSAIFIEGPEGSLGLATDRSVGGTSLLDGSIEVMVQRRILKDDWRGVSEPLNETTLGVNPYPPYGDATRQGEGVIIKGTHRLMIGGEGDGAMLARLEMDKMFASPLVFVASAPSTTPVPLKNYSFALLQEALPPNVMLITYKLLSEAPATTFLIRLGHQFGEGEEVQHFSKPTTVCLGKLLSPQSILSITEKTLSGNQDHEIRAKTRLVWTNKGATTRHPVVCVGGSCMVELNPMEIRTFHVQVQNGGVYSKLD